MYVLCENLYTKVVILSLSFSLFTLLNHLTLSWLLLNLNFIRLFLCWRLFCFFFVFACTSCSKYCYFSHYICVYFIFFGLNLYFIWIHSFLPFYAFCTFKNWNWSKHKIEITSTNSNLVPLKNMRMTMLNIQSIPRKYFSYFSVSSIADLSFDFLLRIHESWTLNSR